jgi:ABC-type amino acid transport substrate-binding protein
MQLIKLLLTTILFTLTVSHHAKLTINPGTLTVAVAPEFPSLVYYHGADNEPTGLEVDYAKLIANELGLELKLVTVKAEQLIDAVTNGSADIAMGAIKVLPETSFKVHLTSTFLQSSQMAILHYDRIVRLSGPGQLYRADKTIGVIAGSTGEKLARADIADGEIVTYARLDSAITALRNKRIDYLIHDATTSWYLAMDRNFKDLQSLYNSLNKEELAWAISKSNPLLAQKVDRLLRNWNTNGILDVMNRRWIKAKMEIN